MKKYLIYIVFLILAYFAYHYYMVNNHWNVPAQDSDVRINDDIENEFIEREVNTKQSKENLLKFTDVKTRMMNENKSFVHSALGKPDKTYSKAGSWTVWLYFNKIEDSFDNNRMKHLAIWFKGLGEQYVYTVDAYIPKSQMYAGGNYIQLP